MGICDGRPFRCVAARGTGDGCEVVHGQLDYSERRQHSMRKSDSGPFRCTAIRSIGKGREWFVGSFKAQDIANRVWKLAS